MVQVVEVARLVHFQEQELQLVHHIVHVVQGTIHRQRVPLLLIRFANNVKMKVHVAMADIMDLVMGAMA